MNPTFVAPAVDAAWARDDARRSCSPTVSASPRGYVREIIGTPSPTASGGPPTWPGARPTPVRSPGIPLASAHRTRGWTDDPVVDVWRACERIRERRHESHRNAWTAAGLGPVRASACSRTCGADRSSARCRARGLPRSKTARSPCSRERGLVDGDEITRARARGARSDRTRDRRARRPKWSWRWVPMPTSCWPCLRRGRLPWSRGPASSSAVRDSAAWAEPARASRRGQLHEGAVDGARLHRARRAGVRRSGRGRRRTRPTGARSWGRSRIGGWRSSRAAQAAALDALGVAHGERVAVVSHNSARLLTSFFGVSAYGRIVVPINFRLSADGGERTSSSTPAHRCCSSIPSSTRRSPASPRRTGS